MKPFQHEAAPPSIVETLTSRARPTEPAPEPCKTCLGLGTIQDRFEIAPGNRLDCPTCKTAPCARAGASAPSSCPVLTKYDFAQTGRSSASRPNISNVRPHEKGLTIEQIQDLRSAKASR